MAKNKGGRPTKYKPEYCELLLTHMGKGFSYDSFAGVVGVWKDVLYDWEKKFPEFSHSKKKGRAAGLKTMEAMGLAGAMGKIKNFNLGAWCFFMKNVYHWSDRREVSIGNDSKGVLKLAYKLDKE